MAVSISAKASAPKARRSTSNAKAGSCPPLPNTRWNPSRPASRHGIPPDDANVNNGSERLPTINPDVKVTSYGFDGTNFCRAQQVLGTSVDGTFGIVGHLKDISFFEDLSHTLRVAFYRGTNNTENVRQKMITKPSETVSSMYYMTTADKAWEVNVDSEYKIYKNLSLFLELGYIRMDLDSNVWKDYESKKNNFKGAVCVLYSF